MRVSGFVCKLCVRDNLSATLRIHSFSRQLRLRRNTRTLGRWYSSCGRSASSLLPFGLTSAGCSHYSSGSFHCETRHDLRGLCLGMLRWQPPVNCILPCCLLTAYCPNKLKRVFTRCQVFCLFAGRADACLAVTDRHCLDIIFHTAVPTAIHTAFRGSHHTWYDMWWHC